MKTWTVADVMTRSVTAGESIKSDLVTTTPGATLATAASLMFEHRLNVLPVFDAEKRLVGIVSRSQMLKAFIRSDETIRKEIVRGLLDVSLVAGGSVEVEVLHGVVYLHGEVGAQDVRERLDRAVAGVPGVVGVENYLQVGGEPV